MLGLYTIFCTLNIELIHRMHLVLSKSSLVHCPGPRRLSNRRLTVLIRGVCVNIPVSFLLSCLSDWHAFGGCLVQKPWLITNSLWHEASQTVPNPTRVMLLHFKWLTATKPILAATLCDAMLLCSGPLSALPFFRSHNARVSDYGSFAGLFCVIKSFNCGPRHKGIR